MNRKSDLLPSSTSKRANLLVDSTRKVAIIALVYSGSHTIIGKACKLKGGCTGNLFDQLRFALQISTWKPGQCFSINVAFELIKDAFQNTFMIHELSGALTECVYPGSTRQEIHEGICRFCW